MQEKYALSLTSIYYVVIKALVLGNTYFPFSKINLCKITEIWIIERAFKKGNRTQDMTDIFESNFSDEPF